MYRSYSEFCVILGVPILLRIAVPICSEFSAYHLQGNYVLRKISVSRQSGFKKILPQKQKSDLWQLFFSSKIAKRLYHTVLAAKADAVHPAV